MNVLMIASTNGKGPHTEVERDTEIGKIMIESATKSEDGSIQVFLKAKVMGITWQTWRDGMICGDEKWLRDFRTGLVEMGLAKRLASKVEYTDVGMQGRLHVSLVFNGAEKDIPELEEFFDQRIRFPRH